MTRCRTLLLAAVAVPAMCFASPPPGNMADTSAARYYWINAGAGIATSGITLGGGGSYLIDSTIMTVRVIYTEEFQILGPKPANSVLDVGFMAGYCIRRPYGTISIQGGLSLVTGVQRGDRILHSGWFDTEYESSTFATVGIPIEVQYFLVPTNHLGLGITAFVDINAKETFAGVLVALKLGNLQY